MMKYIFLTFLVFSAGLSFAQHYLVGVDRFSAVIKDSTVQKLDLRTESEYHAFGHIEGFEQINCMSKKFTKRVLARFDTTGVLAVYCMSGHRSPKAVEQLQLMGFHTIYELDGGLLDWLGRGYKVE